MSGGSGGGGNGGRTNGGGGGGSGANEHTVSAGGETISLTMEKTATDVGFKFAAETTKPFQGHTGKVTWDTDTDRVSVGGHRFEDKRELARALEREKGKVTYTPSAKSKASSENLRSSHANDVMEGGKSFRNPSSYRGAEKYIR